VPEHPLKALTPLGNATAQTDVIAPTPAQGSSVSVTITENIAVALASLAVRKGGGAAVAKAAKGLKIDLPAAGHASDTALWLGPDQWMIEAPFAQHEDIVAYLKPAFKEAASITEQTDAWVRFDLTGPDLHAMFERLCNLDTRAMQAGHGTRTVIDHLGCYVICRSDHFTILGPRSSAGSLHHALMTAAKSAY
jgi:sarcosine oxidase, subunit gamma